MSDRSLFSMLKNVSPYWWFLSCFFMCVALGFFWISIHEIKGEYIVFAIMASVFVFFAGIFSFLYILLSAGLAAIHDRPIRVESSGDGVRIVARGGLNGSDTNAFMNWGATCAALFFCFIFFQGFLKGEPRGISLIMAVVGVLLAVVFGVRAVRVSRHALARRRHPGHIVFTPWGVSQRVGNTVNEARWEDIRVLWHFMKTHDGEVFMDWRVLSDVSVRHRAGKEAQGYRQEQYQQMRLVMTPVTTDLRPWVAVLPPSSQREEFIEALSSPERVEAVEKLMTADDPSLRMWPSWFSSAMNRPGSHHGKKTFYRVEIFHAQKTSDTWSIRRAARQRNDYEELMKLKGPPW